MTPELEDVVEEMKRLEKKLYQGDVGDRDLIRALQNLASCVRTIAEQLGENK